MALHLFQGGLGGETLVILEYAHAGGREAAAALPLREGLRRRIEAPPPRRPEQQKIRKDRRVQKNINKYGF